MHMPGSLQGTAALEAPFDDPMTYRRGRGIAAYQRSLWSVRRDYLLLHAPIVRELCATHVEPIAVKPSWVLAILWDELARRDITESLSDWLLGRLGRDPSVGPFQVTGRTGCEVVRFVSWGDPYRELSRAEMRSLMLDFSFSARIVIGRIQQTLRHWQTRGFDPLDPGGLGPDRLSPIALVGTLYSLGLGVPKANPRANARGAQIEAFATALGVDSSPRSRVIASRRCASR
jgi:hypothetical protein